MKKTPLLFVAVVALSACSEITGLRPGDPRYQGAHPPCAHQTIALAPKDTTLPDDIKALYPGGTVGLQFCLKDTTTKH